MTELEAGILGGGEREVDAGEGCVDVRGELGYVGVVIERGKNPQVGALQAECGVGLGESYVQADVGGGGLEGAELRAQGGDGGRVGRKQTLAGVGGAGVTEDERGAEFAAVGHADADGACTFEQDGGDLGAGDYGSAGLLDLRDHGGRDGARAACGITGSGEVMLGNGGVDGKAGLRGRQAIVAPLRREDADEFLVGGEAFQDFAGGAAGPAQGGRAHEAADEGRGGGRDGFFCIVKSAEAIRGLDRGDVAVDGARFAGEGLEKGGAEAVEAGGEVEGAACDEEAVVHLGHGLPLDVAGGDVVEGATDGGVWVLDLTDVVQAYVPLVSGTAEGVGEAAGFVVALEDQDALAAVDCEQDGRGESTDAGAPADGGPALGGVCLFVWSSVGHCFVLLPQLASGQC